MTVGGARLTAVTAESLERLRPLYEGFPGLHGLLDAILDGGMGDAYADDPALPTVALLKLEFSLIAGDPAAPAAQTAVGQLKPPASIVVSDGAWEPLLREAWGGRLSTRTRTAVVAGEWDRSRLAELRRLPDGFTMARITCENVDRFAVLEDSLVYNFPSRQQFVEMGVGFGIEHDGQFVAGCSSFAISSRKLEFEIQTHPDYRRRGLAAAAAARMIEHCLDAGLEPCWDAHNEMSLALALKLGFRDPAPYTAFEL